MFARPNSHSCGAQTHGLRASPLHQASFARAGVTSSPASLNPTTHPDSLTHTHTLLTLCEPGAAAASLDNLTHASIIMVPSKLLSITAACTNPVSKRYLCCVQPPIFSDPQPSNSHSLAFPHSYSHSHAFGALVLLTHLNPSCHRNEHSRHAACFVVKPVDVKLVCCSIATLTTWSGQRV